MNYSLLINNEFLNKYIIILFQNALLDLLGGTQDSIDLDIIKQSTQTNIPPISNSNNQDLLDLLGLDPLPSTNNDIVTSPTSKNVTSNNLGLVMENNNSNLLAIVNNQNSNFLMDDLISTININDTINGK